MRIAYDHRIFFLQKYGGISRYFYEIARLIDQIPECETRIIAPFHRNGYIGMGDVDVRGCRVPEIRGTGRVLLALNHALSWPLSIPGFDILHETYFQRSPPPIRCRARVVTVHDMIYERFPDLFSTGEQTRRLKKIALQRADHVICNSNQTKLDLMEFHEISEEKVSVIYLGYRLSRSFPGMPSTAPVKNDSLGDYILYVGQRDKYKNFERLLRAFVASRLPRDGFRLVCFGGGDFKRDERILIESLGLPEGLVIGTGGSDELLSELYQNATCFVYPSLYEGFGIPLLEAMGHDCPVACSSVGSIPEVAGDAALYFDPTDTDSILDAIERIIYDPSLRRQFIERGRERIKGFSWEKCAQETAVVYKNLI